MYYYNPYKQSPFPPPPSNTSPIYALFTKETIPINVDLLDASFEMKAQSSSYFFSDYTISLIGRAITFIFIPSFILFILYISLKAKFIKSLLEDGAPLEDGEFYYV